ncbi:MAG TPA: MarR family transcriptional regulator [Acidimicrobiales bacterium]|nr:MarR family transcriptional regulator [Acidimicrobiales bacterium]
MPRPVTATPTATPTATTSDALRTLVRISRTLEHACTELTLPQYRLLAMVAKGDRQASQLAGRLALSKPTITAVVDGLVERGLLARSEVAADRRAIQLTLTRAGRDALNTTEAAMAERLQRLLDRCDDPGLAMAGLAQLGRALDLVVAERLAAGGK